MTNSLAHENSPYLLQHAGNPVDWYPWSEEALTKAKKEDKPIFLSIGYAACHWCHVMAHESFEDPQTAAIMNENFVNIKVDREERPDLDGIYMNAVVAMTGQGGWPMSLFLTPEGVPFFGGTYFPPDRRYNMPSFKETLLSVAQAWKEHRDELLASGKQITANIQGALTLSGTPQLITIEALNQATQALEQSYDKAHGGWGKAPKFPQPMTIEFLLRQACRGDKNALETAVHGLKSMARGGMYDLVGGGFARYSTDNDWLVPHFEKMLYDNAQLARVYLHAYLLTGEAEFQHVCVETLDFVLRVLTNPEGGFYSSLDADSEGEEGKYYVWSLEEIRQVINDPAKLEFFLAAFHITEGGNFEGKNVLRRALGDQQLAEKFNISIEQAADEVKDLLGLLFTAREKRIPPGTDDKVLVSWNALMLITYAEAARYLKRSNYLEAAKRNAHFLLESLHPGDRLLRSWRNGNARHNAYLEDYAALILGLLALYQSDADPFWFISASELCVDMVKHYSDPQGGFFDTRDDQQTPLLRPKEVQDNATPSGNALAAEALLQLSAYNGRGDWRDLAEEMLSSMQTAAIRYPSAFGEWLSAMDFAVGPSYEVAILGDPNEAGMSALLEAIWSEYRPRLVAAITSYPPEAGSPPLLLDRDLKNSLPTAYVCQHLTCKLPVNDPDDLIAQLDS